MKEQPIILAVQEYDSEIVFTTNYREVYKKLMTFCEDANIAESDENSRIRELNDFHAQCWISVEKAQHLQGLSDYLKKCKEEL